MDWNAKSKARIIPSGLADEWLWMLGFVSGCLLSRRSSALCRKREQFWSVLWIDLLPWGRDWAPLVKTSHSCKLVVKTRSSIIAIKRPCLLRPSMAWPSWPATTLLSLKSPDIATTNPLLPAANDLPWAVAPCWLQALLHLANRCQKGFQKTPQIFADAMQGRGREKAGNR